MIHRQILVVQMKVSCTINETINTIQKQLDVEANGTTTMMTQSTLTTRELVTLLIQEQNYMDVLDILKEHCEVLLVGATTRTLSSTTTTTTTIEDLVEACNDGSTPTMTSLCCCCCQRCMPSSSSCPLEVELPISTLIYSSTRITMIQQGNGYKVDGDADNDTGNADLRILSNELDRLRELFQCLFGTQFINHCLNNTRRFVHHRVVTKLSYSDNGSNDCNPNENVLLVDEYIKVFLQQKKHNQQLQQRPQSTPDNNYDDETAASSSSSYVVRRRRVGDRNASSDGSRNPKRESGEVPTTGPKNNIALSSTMGLSPILPLYIFRPNSNLEIAFDTRTKNPIYVLEKLPSSDEGDKGGDDATAKVGNTRRPSNSRPQFYEETRLPIEYRSRLNHYIHSGYDRGHMAPAGDFNTRNNDSDNKGGGNCDKQVNDTYNLCNISPQVRSMNMSIWKRIENYCRRLHQEEEERKPGGRLQSAANSPTTKNGSISATFIVTGPLWLPEKSCQATQNEQYQYCYPAIGATRDDQGDNFASPPLTTTTLVHVPTHFFKLVAIIDTATTTIRKYACFVVPNTPIESKYKAKPTFSSPLREYIMSWEELEIMSGLQFFPSISRDNAQILDG